jgi:hypothetical protein
MDMRKDFWQMIYFSRPDWQGVVELLFFDRSNPRSVGFQTLENFHRKAHDIYSLSVLLNEAIGDRSS